MLSVIIIAKNEQDRIKTCLESVKWADEIIFFDNQSSDKTVEIAKKYTDKIFEFKDLDYADVKNNAFKKTSCDWVLYLDADERILEPLKREILDIARSDKYGAYAISRINIIFGTEVHYGPYKKDWVIRLVKRSEFDTWVGKVHEYLKFKGELGYTENSFLHLTHRNIDHFILKSLEWSKIDAKLRLESHHPKMSGWRFLRIFVTEVFNQGILRKGFFNGTVGVMDSLLQSFSLYITYVRLWELQQQKPLNELYDEIDSKLEVNGFVYK